MTNRIRHSSKPVRSNTSRKRIEQADQQPGQPSEPTNPPRYSTREITWEEQKSLGGDFKKVGKGSWPAAGIIDERIIRKRKQYLVDWESHPLTLEVFPPTWVASSDVSEDHVRKWNNKQKALAREFLQPTEVLSNGRVVSRTPRPTRDTRTSSATPARGSLAGAKRARGLQYTASPSPSPSPSESPNPTQPEFETERPAKRPRIPPRVPDSSSDAESLIEAAPEGSSVRSSSRTTSSRPSTRKPSSPANATSVLLSLEIADSQGEESELPSPNQRESPQLQRELQPDVSETEVETHEDSLYYPAESELSPAAIEAEHDIASSAAYKPRKEAGVEPIPAEIPQTNSSPRHRFSTPLRGPGPSLPHINGIGTPSSLSIQTGTQDIASSLVRVGLPASNIVQQRRDLLPRRERTQTSHASSSVSTGKQRAQIPETPVQYLQPATRHLPSSGTSSGSVLAPESDQVGTSDHSTVRRRNPSVELGSASSRRALTVAELVHDDAASSQVHQSSKPPVSSPEDRIYPSGEEHRRDNCLLACPKHQPLARSFLQRLSQPLRPLTSRSLLASSDPYPSDFLLGEQTQATRAPARQAPKRSTLTVNSEGQPLADTPADDRHPNLVAMDLNDSLGSSSGEMNESHNLSGYNASEATNISDTASQAPPYDAILVESALPIQNSIEEEQQPSNDELSSEESKPNSSQQSAEGEREVPQVDGYAVPTLPILGPGEYAIVLPAEGKIQSTYADIITEKRKTLLKFINRPESVGSSNGPSHLTHERNEMVEMIQRLNDTTTHMDLGLPGFATQFSIPSQEAAFYSNYAGAKFGFLGHLVDLLRNVGCSLVVMAHSGPTQDLIEQYLTMKHVNVRRQDRIVSSGSPIPTRPSTDFEVELVSTMSSQEVSLCSKPILMIAFDASFDPQDPHVARIRSEYSTREQHLLPVLYLLTSNSAEHVDRCIPRNMPSPMRLKALVRATYQALPNMGGKLTYVPHPSDEPDGRGMDFADLQRGLRKSPERKLVILANAVMQAALSPNFSDNWSIVLPALQLTELEETYPKPSKVAKADPTSTVPETPSEGAPQSRTPISRADTPSGRKRLLDVEGAGSLLSKRQRLTPLRDQGEASAKLNDSSNQVAQLEDLVNKLQLELTSEKEARTKSEQERDHASEQLGQWKEDHAELQRRYEKRMTKCHELERENKKLLKSIENQKAKNERLVEEASIVKQANRKNLLELEEVRAEIKAAGGDGALLEQAREEARTLLANNTILEKALDNKRQDFEFTRAQYQDASTKAAEFAGQIRELEEQISKLTQQAGDERRRLKETNFQSSIQRHLDKISELELERKSRDVMLRKLEEENRQLKRSRGVQTRGSSVQPPGSPGMDGHGSRGPRSRQGSPAPGLFTGSHHTASTSRGSLLRHER